RLRGRLRPGGGRLTARPANFTSAGNRRSPVSPFSLIHLNTLPAAVSSKPGRVKFWGPPATGPAVPISAKQLCQALLDAPQGRFFRYCNKVLEVEGVVSERHVLDGFRDPGPEDPLGAVIFLVPVTDKKTSASKEYYLGCNFWDPIPPGDLRRAALAK